MWLPQPGQLCEARTIEVRNNAQVQKVIIEWLAI